MKMTIAAAAIAATLTPAVAAADVVDQLCGAIADRATQAMAFYQNGVPYNEVMYLTEGFHHDVKPQIQQLVNRAYQSTRVSHPDDRAAVAFEFGLRAFENCQYVWR